MEEQGKSLVFILIGHAHIDPVWLWDWREGYEAVKATFRSALDRMAENPDLVFAHSSAAHYAWMEDHPALLAEIRAAVARGQWEPVGGWWVEADVNIPSGESLARQGLYGQRYMERVLGRRATVAFLPDSFGHPPTLPQILRESGLQYFLFMRPGANEIDLPSNLFWWEGPDGTRILAARVECYNTSPATVETSLRRNLDWRPPEAREWIGLYGVGNHGGGPTKKLIQSIRDLDRDPAWPSLRLGNLAGFFARAEDAPHPTFAGSLRHHARGCYSANSTIKFLNRRTERTLLAAEAWSALASFYGRPYPAEALTQAWQRLLFNQFHDILAGSCLASAYEDAHHEFGAALAAAGRALFGALQTVAQRVETRRDDRVIEEVMRRPRCSPDPCVADLGDGVPVIVFNPHAWPRREVIDVEVNDWQASDLRVLDHENRPVAHQFVQPESAAGGRPRAAFLAEVPPLGYRVYRLVDEPPAPLPAAAPPLEAEPTRLENTWWRLILDPFTGALRSLYDKERRLELLAGPGAQLLVMEDPYDTWGHGLIHLRQLAGVFGEPAVVLAENGAVRATLAVTVRYRDSWARQEITLYRDLPSITGRLTVNWQERHKALKLAFPFAIADPTATFSAPYGHATVPAAGAEEPLQEWLDLTGRIDDARGVPHHYGVALLNDGKYGGDVLGGEARLTVLRSPVYAHHDPAPLDPGLVYVHQDQGQQRLRWALVPHAGSWQEAGICHAAAAFNAPLLFVREYAHPGELPREHGFLTVDPPGAALPTALKQAEDGDDLILRLFEPHGREASVKISLPAAGVAFTAALGPHQIKTFRLSRDGRTREVNFLEEEPSAR